MSAKTKRETCPKCGKGLPEMFEVRASNVAISQTVRCRGCDCSIGMSLFGPPTIVYDSQNQETESK